MYISEDMLIEIVKNSVAKSRKSILRKIENNVAERSFYCDIMARLVSELETKGLSDYSIDSEYNRAFGFDKNTKGVAVYDESERIVRRLDNNTFDVVVHLNGEGDIAYPENLIHIEVKKRKNKKGRKEDRQRLQSTTRFSNELSTRYLGVIFEPDQFESLYDIYTKHCKDRAIQIKQKEQIDDIIKINKEIFNQYISTCQNNTEWFSSIIAGYQLGAFIDIGEDNILIEYYSNGRLLEKEEISYK